MAMPRIPYPVDSYSGDFLVVGHRDKVPVLRRLAISLLHGGVAYLFVIGDHRFVFPP